MTNEEMLAWAASARRRALKNGTMDALWELIFDAESIVKDGVTFVNRGIIERMIEEDRAKLQ